jgi:4-amino-4-deoxy-L-arabinose transferase-like glycosyltransferase
MLKSGFLIFLEHKWDYILAFAVFLLAFALRYHFLVTYRYPMMVHEQDAVGYMDAAKSFLHLRLPTVAGRPPGYPIVIALFALLPVGLEFAARLASIFMDALVVLPLYYIARIYLSRAGALAVCLLWAFFSFSLYFSTSPLSQSSYLCFLLFGVAFLYFGYEKRGLTWFFCSGIFMALSYLARPEGIVGFCYGLFFCLTLLIGKNGTYRKNILLPICFIAGFLLLAGPYLIAMRITLGGWTISALTAAQVKSADTVLTLNAKLTLSHKLCWTPSEG